MYTDRAVLPMAKYNPFRLNVHSIKLIVKYYVEKVENSAFSQF